jgi:hypothetical protein
LLSRLRLRVPCCASQSSTCWQIAAINARPLSVTACLASDAYSALAPAVCRALGLRLRGLTLGISYATFALPGALGDIGARRDTRALGRLMAPMRLGRVTVAGVGSRPRSLSGRGKSPVLLRSPYVAKVLGNHERRRKQSCCCARQHKACRSMIKQGLDQLRYSEACHYGLSLARARAPRNRWRKFTGWEGGRQVWTTVMKAPYAVLGF